MITFNQNLKLIFSDVDETIADLYTDASLDICKELEKILEHGTALFLISGQGIQSIKKRVIDQLQPELRKNILVGPCNGAEVWGFDKQGNLNEKAYYSLYEKSLTSDQKTKWREIVNSLVNEFNLHVYPTTPIAEFKARAGNNPLAIMLEDRDSQITFEVINGYDLSQDQEKEIQIHVPNTHGHVDLRIPILERANQLLQQNNISITARLGGIFAIDLAVEGVSKTTAIEYILHNEEILHSIGLTTSDLKPENLEVWGDKFSTIRGGADRHMSEALPKEVRSIDFRQENPKEFLADYNIVLWDGKKHLHEGLLEFLQSTK